MTQLQIIRYFGWNGGGGGKVGLCEMHLRVLQCLRNVQINLHPTSADRKWSLIAVDNVCGVKQAVHC